jgi:hypothetical protein
VRVVEEKTIEVTVVVEIQRALYKSVEGAVEDCMYLCIFYHLNEYNREA